MRRSTPPESFVSSGTLRLSQVPSSDLADREFPVQVVYDIEVAHTSSTDRYAFGARPERHLVCQVERHR